jgi:hypothetical protein
MAPCSKHCNASENFKGKESFITRQGQETMAPCSKHCNASEKFKGKEGEAVCLIYAPQLALYGSSTHIFSHYYTGALNCVLLQLPTAVG